MQHTLNSLTIEYFVRKISTLLQCADGEDSNLGTNTFSADVSYNFLLIDFNYIFSMTSKYLHLCRQ